MASKETKVFWKIKSIDLVSFKAEEKVKAPSEYDPDKMNFELGNDINIDPTSQQVTILFQAKVFSNETHEELLGSIQTKAEFLLQNFEEVIKAHENKFPANLLAVLIGVALSTTRGMLILLSKGSVFENAMIPIINPMIFFPKTTEEQKPKASE